MDHQTKPDIARVVFPFAQVLKDGTILRLEGTEVVPPGFDAETGVLSKDVIISKTGVKSRLYRPTTSTNKLPLMVYFHGGGFFIASIADPKYHDSLNKIVAEANILLVSIDYRLAPENPLPVPYEDSWAALQWIASHVDGEGCGENWIRDYADWGQLFLAGDSAGANISHHLGMKISKCSDMDMKVKIRGIIMIHPYFWGEFPIGKETTDHFRKSMVDNWWSLVCPSDRGNDDPFINPFVDGSPSLAGLACERVLVAVAENDILRDRGWLYYEKLKKSGWEGQVEIVETEGVDHVFHVFNPSSVKAQTLFKRLSSFINNHGKSLVSIV